jgi:Skp family chaperone for outer membrane proteins
MKKKQKAIVILLGVALTAGLLSVSPSVAQDTQKVERLERMIEEQQQQLESMRRELNQLKQTAADAQTKAAEAKSEASQATTAVQETIGKKDEFRNLVSSSPGKIKLAISGQVNRAVNIIDDGKNTDAYFVDNDASNSRVRFVGTAKATDDLTIGSRIEVAFAPNESSQVNQNSEESGDFFDERWAEVSLASKRFGKVSLGKGDTASNNSAEVDLSKVDVVDYASIADIAGGMLFRQSSGDNSLTNVKVSDAFKDLDGLSRKSRLRYDTPTFYGFSLAGSLVSDQRYDASLWWGGQGFGFKAVAAAAITDPNEDNTDLQYDGSLSVLHEGTGLNLTLSAGLKERDDQGDQQNFYGKLGWLTRFFSFGQTAFAVSGTRSVNFPTGRDDGYSYAGTVNQIFENFGTELYLQYRVYSLNRDVEPSVEDMYVCTIGTRVKF